MTVTRWIVLFTGATLMCCAEESVELDAEEAPPETSVGLPPLPPIEDVIAEALAIEHAEPAVVVVAPRVGVPVHVLSDVERAEGFYTACFSELPRERRPCRSSFNRRIAEAELIRRFRTPGLLNITRLVLGRIILSEANWLHDERRDHNAPESNHAEVDAPLIYQVLRYTRRQGETLLGAMRRHAPHVSEARPIPRPERHRRMVWVRELQLSCRRPPHFPALAADGGEMNWERDYRPRCEALFAFAQRLLEGDAEALGSWTSAPVITWGGRCEDVHGACDDHIAEGRRLAPYETGSTANRFWCRPGAEGCSAEPVMVTLEPAP